MIGKLKNYQYGNSIGGFLSDTTESIFGILTLAHEFDSRRSEFFAWHETIEILKAQLQGLVGSIYLEYDVPRIGHRIDAVIIHNGALFVIEFKVSETRFLSADRDQVWDYALDLHNFHEPSHDLTIIPVLLATEAAPREFALESSSQDLVFKPILINSGQLRSVLLSPFENRRSVPENWADGRYKPTPTIIDAAKALYKGHGVEAITKSGAAEQNLTATTMCIDQIIERSRRTSKKSICFVTGVPGAGKTLVGLNVATKHSRHEDGEELHAIYLSGNGPLVRVLTEALARDRVTLSRSEGSLVRLKEARSQVKAFIQIVHHFRDDCIKNEHPPIDHIAIFDEAQRAWNLEQTASFMQKKKGLAGFNKSEPEYLVSCLDRHKDWATVVCLVGGGQEINRGEAGILEWINAIKESFHDWDVYLSSNLSDSEHNPTGNLDDLLNGMNVQYFDDLHLSVSLRSFRSEHLSHLVKTILDLEVQESMELFSAISTNFPIRLTRDLNVAREWLKAMRRGTERSGLVVSSNAERLKAKGIHVKAPIDPVHWFLQGHDDVRSSCFHEDVATEFDVQGLELDWVGVVWDADFRWSKAGWQNFEFKGNKWQQVKKPDRQMFQKNAYRVLLTRARQGMVLVVPEGNIEDNTRQPAFYDGTYEYLKGIGIPIL